MRCAAHTPPKAPSVRPSTSCPRSSPPVSTPAKEPNLMKPTIVLVHGAFAESASWNGVIKRLHAAGHPVIAAGNPLRSLSGDAASVSSILATISGPVVLVGHSYGGAVASNAAVGHDNVKALVFV